MTETVTEQAAVALIPAPPEGVQWTLRGLEILDPDLSFEDYERILFAAGEIKTASSFIIGDALIFGEARYGERYAQAMDATGLSYGTISNYVYVCKQVTRSRRRDGLRFGHHEAIASLTPEQQIVWLDRAEASSWSREELRDALRDAGAIAPRKVPAPRENQPQQTVLDAPTSAKVVDAARSLSTVQEVLVLTEGHLQDGHGANDLAERLPRARRALEEASATIRGAAAAEGRTATLLDAAKRVVGAGVRQRALPDPAYIVPADAFEALQALVADGSPEEEGER